MHHCSYIMFEFIILQFQITKNFFLFSKSYWLFLYTEMLLVAEASSFYVIENCFEHPIISLLLSSGKCVLQILQPIPWLFSEKQE